MGNQSSVYVELAKKGIEKWLDIPGYLGYYQVSNLGRVKSFNKDNHRYKNLKEKILKPSVSKSGYEHVTLSFHKRKTYPLVHRLMGSVFLGNVNNLVVDHIDGNKLNNRLDNLEIVTYRENNLRAVRLGLVTGNGKRVKHLETGKIYKNCKVAEINLNIPRQSISYCANGTTKSAYGQHFEYVKVGA